MTLDRSDSERVTRIMQLSGDVDAMLVVSRALAIYEADLLRAHRLLRQAKQEDDIKRPHRLYSATR